MQNKYMIKIRSSLISWHFKWIILLVIMFSMISLTNAQNPLVTNTINDSKRLIDAKDFSAAAAKLGAFEKQYPGNIWIERLYAQTLFWMHDFNSASKVYKSAISFHPENMDVKYEYAIMLFNYKHYKEAEKLLVEYTSANPDSDNAQILLGKIYYYNHQFSDAYTHLQKAVRINPNDKNTAHLYQEVYRIISPQLYIGGGYRVDEQPMNTYGPEVKFSRYRSNMLDYGISGNFLLYSDIPTSNSISSLLLSNSFSFPKSNIQVRLSAGAYYSKLGSKFDWNTGSNADWGGTIELIKKFKKPFQINIKAERKNYDYTVGSAGSLLMISHYTLNMLIGKQSGWNGMVGVQSNFFPDDNNVNSYYLWFLSRPLTFSNISMSFGYAFNYSNSKYDRFTSVNSYSQIINNNNYDNIEGVYNPYYTPINQMSNSILANIIYHFGSKSKLSGHASVGVFSTIDAPYLYLDNDEMGKTNLVTGYSNQNYIPLDLGLSLRSALSDKVELDISYTYLSTYYFTSNNFKAGVNIYLK